MQGKAFFTLGVCNVVATVWLVAALHKAMVYFFIVKMFLLFGLRFFIYMKSNYHYFM